MDENKDNEMIQKAADLGEQLKDEAISIVHSNLTITEMDMNRAWQKHYDDHIGYNIQRREFDAGFLAALKLVGTSVKNEKS